MFRAIAIAWLFARQYTHKFLATILCAFLFKVLYIYALSRRKRSEATAPQAA